jgi:hypothetical protein
MPHVTFVHGIGNKVEPELLERAWVDALRDSGGPDLWSEGVTTSLCYWADLLYEHPLPATAATHEAGEEADVQGATDVGDDWYEALPPDEQAAIRELAAETGAVTWLFEDGDDGEDGADGAATAPVEAPGAQFERVPLPGPLKRRLMKAFLRDVHHYLWDAEYSPGSRPQVRVRHRIRELALAAMTVDVPRPHVLVGHSLGSVIAYDVLQNVPGAPTVDGLVTLGSPLGLDEVQDRLRPGWSRWDGFPTATVAGHWVNVYDRLDPVCGLDPDLANDFRQLGRTVVHDVDAPNWGTWRHSVTKYLRGSELRAALVEALDLA